MARWTDERFLEYRHYLRQEWTEGRKAPFLALSATEQWDLHRFFAPTKDLTDEGALAHRREAAASERGLPQRVGKIAAHLPGLLANREELDSRNDEVHEAFVAAGRKKTKNSERRIWVEGVARPVPDAERLCRAVLEHVRELEKQGKKPGDSLR